MPSYIDGTYFVSPDAFWVTSLKQPETNVLSMKKSKSVNCLNNLEERYISSQEESKFTEEKNFREVKFHYLRLRFSQNILYPHFSIGK